MDPRIALLLISYTLEQLGIDYFVTGAVAAAAYGEPRATMDLDLVVRVSEAQAVRLCGSLPSYGFHSSDEAARWAARARCGQFSLAHTGTGLKVDFIVDEGSAFDESRFARVRRIERMPATNSLFASPEDVILSKLIDREGRSWQHISDIRGILRVSGPQLDFAYLDR